MKVVPIWNFRNFVNFHHARVRYLYSFSFNLKSDICLVVITYSDTNID